MYVFGNRKYIFVFETAENQSICAQRYSLNERVSMQGSSSMPTMVFVSLLILLNLNLIFYFRTFCNCFDSFGIIYVQDEYI